MAHSVFKITEYCSNCQIDPDFIHSLEGAGLIHTIIIEGERFIDDEQLTELERYRNWHYEMDINIEGIDALRHMLSKFEQLQREIAQLKERLHLYEKI